MTMYKNKASIYASETIESRCAGREQRPARSFVNSSPSTPAGRPIGGFAFLSLYFLLCKMGMTPVLQGTLELGDEVVVPFSPPDAPALTQACPVSSSSKAFFWASLVAQWLRIRLPMQGTRV